jgi:phenylacetate-CoA ligase
MEESPMSITPLHCSLFDLCRKRIDADSRFLSAKGWNCLPSVDFDLFEEYRLFRLRRTLEYVARQSRFYRHLFAESGIDPAEIGEVSDLARLPLTNAKDIAANPLAFLCISQGAVERAVTFVSSGTIGPQKRVFFSRADIEAIIDYMAAGMRTVADEYDVVQILLPGGAPFSQGDLLSQGVSRMGARPVFTGMFVPPEEQIAAIRKNGSTVLFGETHLIYRITKMMEGSCNLRDLGVHTLFLSTSYASPVMAEYLSDTWSARISTHYGLTEMGLGLAVDCPVCGAHHFNELDVIGEVIDPATGRSLPAGSTGELVFTSIGREAMPVVRYRTGDLACFGETNGQCESPLRTIGQVERRVESTVAVEGVTVHPTLFHEVLFGIPEIIDYELSVKATAGIDMLSFAVETAYPGESLQHRIISALKDAPLLRGLSPASIGIGVEFEAPEGLQQGVHFKKTVKDLRERPA